MRHGMAVPPIGPAARDIGSDAKALRNRRQVVDDRDGLEMTGL